MNAMADAKNISTGLAHVDHESDLLVHAVKRVLRPNSYLSTFSVPPNHPSVTEDKVPGSAFQEAGQQLVRAVSHLFQGVPTDHGIAIHESHVAFRAHAKTGVPVEAMVHLEIDRDNPRHFPRQWVSTIDFWQEGVRVAEAHFQFVTLPRSVGNPMMSRHHGHPSAAVA